MALSDIINIDMDDSIVDSLDSTSDLLSGAIAGPRALLGTALENPKTASQILGAASIAYGGHKAVKNLPKGGLAKMYADHSLNFIKGFYAKNAPKTTLYAKEFGEATKRLARLSVDPKGIVAYKGTGVSQLADDFIKTLPQDLSNIDNRYIEGEFGQKGETAIKRARQAKTKQIKQRHYKILNDSANRLIFTGDKSAILENYRLGDGKPWWKVSNAKEFTKLAGSREKAKYMMQVHKIGHQNLPGYGKLHRKVFGDKRLSFGPDTRFIKWSDNYVSGITRGAQFNPKTYFALEELKNSPKIKTILDARVALSNRGIESTTIGKNRLMFNFSPTIKSNFDWGGYNAVAEWNITDKGKVTFTGTDLRDTPISSAAKGKNVLNYVEAKNVSIADLKEEAEIFDDKPKTGKGGRPKGSKNKPTLSDYEARKLNVKGGVLQEKGLYKKITTNLGDVSEKVGKYKSGITAKKAYSKGLRKFGKSRGALAAGVILLLASQFMKKGKEKEILDD